MMAIGAYVSICSSLTQREFEKHHPHPVLLHEAAAPLQPTGDTEGVTINRPFIRPGRVAAPGVPGTSRVSGSSPGPGQLYTVYVLTPPPGATSGRLTIGCSSRCELQINDRSLSKEHALFEAREGRYFLCDNGSASGTRVNDELLGAQQWTEVTSGARLSLGTVSLTFLPADDFYRMVRRLFID